MINKITLVFTAILLSGCGSLVKKLDITMYQDPSTDKTASIEFQNSDPFIYIDNEPTQQKFHFIKSLPRSFDDKGAKLYKDAENCTDYSIFNLADKNKTRYKIESEKLQTIEYRAVSNSKSVLVWCPNTFSFTPETGSNYIIKNTINIEKGKSLKCYAQVFKDGDLENPIEIISRNDKPIFWTNTSPRCDKEELVSPKYVVRTEEESMQCLIKVGSYKC